VSTDCSTCKTRTSVFSCRIPTATARSRSSANPESSTAIRTLMTPLPLPAMAWTIPRQHPTFEKSFCRIACRNDASSEPGQMLSRGVASIEQDSSGMQVTIAHERGRLSTCWDSGSIQRGTSQTRAAIVQECTVFVRPKENNEFSASSIAGGGAEWKLRRIAQWSGGS